MNVNCCTRVHRSSKSRLRFPLEARRSPARACAGRLCSQAARRQSRHLLEPCHRCPGSGASPSRDQEHPLRFDPAPAGSALEPFALPTVTRSERSLGRQDFRRRKDSVMKSKSRKLALHRETLKRLELREVGHAQGGGDVQEISPTAELL